jgi:flagellar motor switch protein FliM
MADQELLSQEEIDALLAMLPQDGSPLPPAISQEGKGGETSSPGSPAAPSEPIRRYDFRRPDKFSKEQVRTLRMMHESMARRLTLSLSAYLRAAVDVTLADIDQEIYANFVEQMPSPAIFHVVSVKPLPGHIIFYTGMDLAYMIVDRLLGGPGTRLNTNREVTELEMMLISGVINKVLEGLQEAWSGVAQIRPRVEDTAVNLLFVNVALPSDPTVWVAFEVRVKQGTGTMAMGIPYSVLKPISGRLSPQTWIAAAEPRASDNEEERAYLQSHLNHVRVPISVCLGTTEISLRELVSLQKGDVLILQTKIKDELPIMVNQEVKFTGRPGQRGNRLAVQVSSLISMNPS